MHTIVLATKNLGKIREFAELLAGWPVRVLSIRDWPDLPEIIEDGATFAENALKKARAVCQHTGLLALADDSGLEVDYLGGAPGVLSARFAGEPIDDDRNNRKLLTLLEGVPLEQRTARFRCVIAIVTPTSESFLTEGICEGIIGQELAGTGGFGYDPLFYLPAYGRTMAQLSLEVKNSISHRAKALREASRVLLELLGESSPPAGGGPGANWRAE
ncbi:MAG: XTP/dITP diphosphatase [Firmicutes bacterium]|nr:XTP/dITP diphosphatase [Bacillota bacterium]